MAYQFRGRDADDACRWRGEAGREDALIAKVADHVKAKHRVAMPTDTIVNFVKTKVRQT